MAMLPPAISALLLLVLLCVPLWAASAAPVAVPTISSVSGCPGQTSVAVFNCQLWIQPLVLTIVGDGLDYSTQLVYVGDSTRCTPSAGNSTALICSVATASSYAMQADVPLPLTVLSLVSGARSPPSSATVTLVVFPTLTTTSVSGCDDRGNAQTYNCNTSTAVLTVQGSGFQAGPAVANFQFYFNAVNPSWAYLTGVYNWSPYSLRVLSDATLTFNLSDIAINNGVRLFNSGQLCITIQRAYITTAASPFCLTFLPTPQNSAVGYAVNMSHPVITNVTGCAISRNNATYGCLRQDLTITGTGFPSLGRVITVGDFKCGEYAGGSQVQTQLICYTSRYWNGPATGQPLPVVVQDLINGVTSEPYYGAAFVDVTVPSITAISGCQGSGQLTSMCVTATDAITLTGTGFTADNANWGLQIGNVASLVYGYTASFIISDTSVVLRLNSSSNLVTSLNQAAAALDVNTSVPVLLLKLGSVLSNSVSLTLAPLFLQLSRLDGCESQSDFVVTDCTPGVSLLTLFASNIYPPLSITVGDVLCAQLKVFSTYVTCLVAAPEGFIPGSGYDVVVVQGYSQVVLAGAVQFTARPIIQTISSAVCAADYMSVTSVDALNCAAGDQVTLIGSFFTASSTLQVSLSNSNGNNQQAVLWCSSVVLLSAWSLQCTLPAVPSAMAAAFLGQVITVNVSETANLTSNPFPARLYRAATAVGVSGISGCAAPAASNGRGTQGCVTSNLLTVWGQNFVVPGGGALQVLLYELTTQVLYECQLPTILSPTQLTCRLPYIALLEAEIQLPLRVQVSATQQSNWFLGVGLSAGVIGGSSSVQDDHSGYKTGLIVALVLLGLVSVCTLVLLAAVCRLSGYWTGGLKLLRHSSRGHTDDDSHRFMSKTSSSGGWPAVEMQT